MKLENSPTLETERLILRKFTLQDTADMLPILDDEQVNTFLPWFPIKTLTEAQAFLQERYISYYKKPWSYRYAICLKENNRPIGYIYLSDDDSFDLGYGISKENWARVMPPRPRLLCSNDFAQLAFLILQPPMMRTTPKAVL